MIIILSGSLPKLRQLEGMNKRWKYTNKCGKLIGCDAATSKLGR
jgi:hypothetical protein